MERENVELVENEIAAVMGRSEEVVRERERWGGVVKVRWNGDGKEERHGEKEGPSLGGKLERRGRGRQRR